MDRDGQRDKEGVHKTLLRTSLSFFSSYSLLRNKIQAHIEFYGIFCFQFNHFIRLVNDPFFSQLDLQKMCSISHHDSIMFGAIFRILYSTTFNVISPLNHTKEKFVHLNAFPMLGPSILFIPSLRHSFSQNQNLFSFSHLC